MSRQEFSVAYAGETRVDDHSIDVQALAPALLAFGRLIREGNAVFNGKKATAKVLVVSDFEHKCFNINFDVVVSFFEQARLFLGLDAVKTAKEVLEWLGLLGTGAGSHISYLKFLEWKKGREIVEEKSDLDEAGTVKVTIKGDNNSVHVHSDVLKLSKNSKALRATKDAFLPLGQDGFETVRISGKDASAFDEFTPKKVDDIVASCNLGIEDAKEEPEPDVETTSAWLTVYSPVYDAKSENWRFKLGRDVIHADITATRIAQEVLARGGTATDDSYQVRLEITTPYDTQGKPKTSTYRILEVLRFSPGRPAVQTSLFDADGGSANGA